MTVRSGESFDLRVIGMSCAACASRLERVLNRQPGLAATVNFASARAVVTGSEQMPDFSTIETVIDKAGFSVGRDEQVLSISGMSCAACSARLEKVLNRLPGVAATVNLASEQAHIRYVNGLVDDARLIGTIEREGFTAHGMTDLPASATPRVTSLKAWRDLIIVALLCIPFLFAMLGMAVGLDDALPVWLQCVLATGVQIYGGRPFYRSAWHALRGFSANMNVLVVMGTSIAYGFSVVVTALDLALPVYFEASAFIILFVSVGRLMEQNARHRAASGLEALLRLAPETAHRIEGTDIVDCPVSLLRLGDFFLLKPGEVVPVDGEIIQGETEIDESMLTGESSPVLRRPGDTIFAGTLNTTGMLQARATSLGSDTALARIVALVSRAQGSKAPIQRLADRVSGIFVPAIIVIATLTFLTGLFVTGHAQNSLVAAISVLVIACPCSLGLATPTAIMVGTARAASAGILFRNAEALERVHRLSVLAFDKTGTLTIGQPVVTGFHPSSNGDPALLLQVVATLEGSSEHPLARAILAFAHQNGVRPQTGLAEFRAVPGQGITGFRDGIRLLLGSEAFLVSNGIAISDADTHAVPPDQTHVHVAMDARHIGVITLADAVRPEARAMLDWLRCQKIESLMLTGDSRAVAECVGKELGIDRISAALRPEDKVVALKALRAKGRVIGMTGDGINDAPALALADVSFAIGSGSAAALETADIVLMTSDLRAISDVLSLSAATVTKIRQNLVFAFGYNIAAIPLAALGYLNPAIAAGAMALSSVSVVTNSLLLNRWRSQRDSVT